ncbi:unnamed protein product [Onchocerca ochengi]|uniref:ZP domain-containing protein n=1 Tax=Onchocerca ochengi TaxID=42157 RepID=A0A182ECB1_ONCOC|nr:unnamed protein product [Onchocerca ochengi]
MFLVLGKKLILCSLVGMEIDFCYYDSARKHPGKLITGLFFPLSLIEKNTIEVNCRIVAIVASLKCQIDPLELRTVLSPRRSLSLTCELERFGGFLDQRQTRLHVQQSRDYNRLAFRYNPPDDYSLSPHVLIDTMTEVCIYCKAMKINGEMKGMCCVTGEIKLPQLEEPSEP